MKSLIAITLLSLISFSAVAESLIYTQITLTKDRADKNGLSFLASPFEKWCHGVNTVISFGSFEAAQYVEKLDNGFYVCDGKFVVGKFNSPVQIFEIAKCSLTDAEVLKGQCP
ncbi:MAG: hypothetical protein H7328_06200 [Bdellovibrio sp.]|nr:hypothetical protein [Bdellovibrio sp.]